MKLNQSRSKAVKISKSVESSGQRAELPIIKNKENAKALP